MDINGNVSESSEKIIKIIKGNPKITTEEISSLLKLTTRAIEKNISKLKEEGMIERIGPDEGGYWKIINEN